jgi:hypothetical protein
MSIEVCVMNGSADKTLFGSYANEHPARATVEPQINHFDVACLDPWIVIGRLEVSCALWSASKSSVAFPHRYVGPPTAPHNTPRNTTHWFDGKIECRTYEACRA